MSEKNNEQSLHYLGTYSNWSPGEIKNEGEWSRQVEKRVEAVQFSFLNSVQSENLSSFYR